MTAILVKFTKLCMDLRNFKNQWDCPRSFLFGFMVTYKMQDVQNWQQQFFSGKDCKCERNRQ